MHVCSKVYGWVRFDHRGTGSEQLRSGRPCSACVLGAGQRVVLLGFGEADPVVLAVEDGVVLADKDVSQDPERAGGGRNVQGHEATQTDGLPSLTLLQHRGDVKEPSAATKLHLFCFSMM